jgi:hypothetical protein
MAGTLTPFAQKGNQDQGNQPATEPGLTIYQRLLAIANDLPVIQKAGLNKEQNYKFIEASAIAATMRELFAKHGVYLKSELARAEFNDFTSKSGAKGEKVIVWFDFSFINCFASDDVVKFEPWPGVAMDYSDKALNKAMTAAQKTFLMKQFLVSDVDPDNDSPEAVSSSSASSNQNQNRPAQAQAQSATQQQRTQPGPPAARPQPAPAPAQPAPAQTAQPQPQPQPKPDIPKMLKEEFDGWLKEMGLTAEMMALYLSEGKQKTMKAWADAWAAANPEAPKVKDWFRFALFKYVDAGARKNPENWNWLWNDETMTPMAMEDQPFADQAIEDIPL